MNDRTILHCDCNGFYASVECSLNPELKSVPMAVGGDSESRHGIILAKNELAKKYNIQTAETIWSAKKKCPGLVIVPPHHKIYREYSKRVMDIYKRYTDLVESFGLDEAWLDVTGSRRLFGDGKTIADELRSVVKKETGLTISVGVSFCKVFAKLGSDYKKPDATTVFTRENWKKYIYPLPVSALLYAGKSTTAVLNGLGIYTIGELAAAPPELIAGKLKKAGEQLYKFANGLDDSPVRSIYDEEEIKSVGNGITFREDLIGEDAVKSGVKILADSVSERLRAKELKCTTVQVHIKDPAFKVISRQKKLKRPVYSSKEIREAAMEIMRSSWNFEKPIRMLSVTGCGLVHENEVIEQLDLFETPDESLKKRERLEKTVDELKHKYGKNIF